MKFIIAREELVKVVASLQNVIAARPMLPLLANIKIEATESELIFTATDLTVAVIRYAHAKVIEAGATTLPARRFFQLAREITAPQVELTCGDDQVSHIHAGSAQFRLHGTGQEEYPQLPNFSSSPSVKVAQGTLKKMLQRTSFAASREDSRYALTGVLMHITGDTTTFVGTDGKRLAKASMAMEIEESWHGQYILPLKAVEEVAKVLSEDNGEVAVYLMHDKVAVEVNDTHIITKLLSGEYPDYTRVIPASSEIEITLHREELMTLLRQISLFTNEHNQAARFTLVPGELTLSANSADIGEGRVAMPADYQGLRFDIAFNPSYFIDILRHCQDEVIQLGLTDPYNPGVIKDSEQSLFVLMPMRFNES